MAEYERVVAKRYVINLSDDECRELIEDFRKIQDLRDTTGLTKTGESLVKFLGSRNL